MKIKKIDHLVPRSINTVTYRERRSAAPARRATEAYSCSTTRERNAAGADAAALECERIYGAGHLGVAVRDKRKAERFLTEILGARKILDEPWVYSGQEFNWAYFDIGHEGRIELISAPDPDNFINRFIDKRGEGLHHVTIQVEDLTEAVNHLRANGVTVLDVNTEHPHWKEAFISPRDAFGVLIQLAEFDEEYWGLGA